MEFYRTYNSFRESAVFPQPHHYSIPLTMAQVADVESTQAKILETIKKEDLAFRRQSIKAGNYETDFVTTSKLVGISTDEELKERVSAFFDFVMSSNDIEYKGAEYVKGNFSDDDDPTAPADYQAFLGKMAVMIKPHLKFSNWGSTGRVIFVVFLTYLDMYTDGEVTLEFFVSIDMYFNTPLLLRGFSLALEKPIYLLLVLTQSTKSRFPLASPECQERSYVQ